MLRAKDMVLGTFFLTHLSFAEVLTPVGTLKEAYKNNPELASSEASSVAERELISSEYSLSSPRIGFMKETDMSFMQMENGPMKTWSVSQELLFPTKYFSRGNLQGTKARRAQHELRYKKLEIRAAALSAYFKYYSASRIHTLLLAQRETLREIARIAETRRSAGTVPQQDEMKAHVEQTRIENQIILQQQERWEAQFALNALLNRPADSVVLIPESDFSAKKDARLLPGINSVNFESSHQLRADSAMFEEAELQKKLAKQNYLPDFMLSYRQVFGGNHPSSGRAIGLEMTVPLWFFSKENSELASAVSREVAAKRRLDAQKRSVDSAVQSLKSRVKTLARLLEIYETALIPQATSTLNSSRSAYSAGRVGFQELLDAERTLYATRVEYYESFSKYIEAVTGLEREAGVSISSLPFSGEET